MVVAAKALRTLVVQREELLTPEVVVAQMLVVELAAVVLAL